MKREEIVLLCKKFEISKYSVNEDGTVDVYGCVDLSNKNLTQIPLKFNIVGGNFDCSNNKLTSLLGAPTVVFGTFDCSHNELQSLVGVSKKVFLDFDCSHNKLTTLSNGPATVRFNYNCSHNNLTDLGGLSKVITKGIFDEFNCSFNALTTIKGYPKGLTKIDCSNNQLSELDDCAKYVHGEFNCKNNPNLTARIFRKTKFSKIVCDQRILVQKNNEQIVGQIIWP